MAINKKLIHFQTLENFKAQLSAGNILDTSICFIKDAKLIWTHGSYYAESEFYVLEQANIDTSTGNGNDILGSISGEEFAKLQQAKVVLLSLGESVNVASVTSVFLIHILNSHSQFAYVDPNSKSIIECSVTLQSDGTALISAEYPEDATYKTINGEEIVGEGDIATRYVIEDLTFEDVQILADGGSTSYPFDASKVVAAFDSGLPVFMRHTANPSVSNMAGMFAVDGYYEDLLYLRITDDQGTVYKIETYREAVDITADNISKAIYAERDRLKTINGEGIVGTGDITIGTAYPMRTGSSGALMTTLNPNEMVVFGVCTSLQVTSFNAGDSSVVNEYLFQFTSGSAATTLTLPSSVKWANDEPPVIEANMIYQISVVNNCATALAFSNS